MSSAVGRLSKLAAHLLPSNSSPKVADALDDVSAYKYHVHTLSPTFFLPRAAAIEPDVGRSLSLPKIALLTAPTGCCDLPQDGKWQDP
jgi:hypothetical protein